ncbi:MULTISPECIES: hypothetical protein [unclassified Acinetobacter]|uniref:hypothetical protein n=1 Tax=unclassified Acinetobacter TaxID=196816 RepID=UPI001D0ED84B|nr:MULTISPECIES: hypothetical protein [unclassified Acinetobacter]
MKKKIGIFIILIGLIMVIATNFEKKYETQISIDLDEDVRKDNLKIIINTYGYLLNGYESSKHIGQTNTYLFLYKDAQIQDYRNTKINKYSDYYIYAKYGNKYAKMKYTNSLVMGNNVTSIKIFIKKFNDLYYISSSNITPSIEAISENSFKDIDAFKSNKHDIKMLGYLDKP